jgi:hypothetical protein
MIRLVRITTDGGIEAERLAVEFATSSTFVGCSMGSRPASRHAGSYTATNTN